jgi:hypothetical protein
MAQEYSDFGDAVVEDGRWLCEHQDDDGAPTGGTELVDAGSGTVHCPDCGTGYVCWDDGGRRLAKPVVLRIPGP